jgi:endonuclease G
MNEKERSSELRSYIARIAPEGGLERLADDEGALESMAPARPGGAPEPEKARARQALRRLAAGEDLGDADRFVVEAIILPEGRPVLDVVGGTYTAPADGLWAHLGNEQARRSIESALRSVGRVELPNEPRIPFGGTGFVVGPDLLMTNRHVAELFCDGLGVRQLLFRSGQSAGVDFKRERGSTDPVVLDVTEVVMVHPFWDMSLLRVAGLTSAQAPLRLSVADPEELAGRDVAILGYPAFDWRNDADLQNRIFGGVYNIKRLQPGKVGGRETVRSFGNDVSAITHDASTLGGNSGSAVVDLGSGEVLGLHFAGKYRKANWAVPMRELARDSFVVDRGLAFTGRVGGGPVPWLRRWQEADADEQASGARPVAAAPHPGASAGRASTPLRIDTGAAVWTIPLEVTVRLGAPMRGGAAASTVAVDEAEVEKPKTLPDPDYAQRKGYDPAFLGHGHEVPLPWLSDAQFADVAFNLEVASQRHVLKYHHFSVVMNGKRRVAFFTAVNIDGNQEMDIDRDLFTDTWSVDPRIADDTYLDNEYYRNVGDDVNPLDRGHLVRRLDPCWGASEAEVLRAHHDTFHWTNSSPQHERYNRNKTTWGGVEDHILHGANNNGLKVCVFTGPVLKQNDPVYTTPTGLDLKMPMKYWKVVVMVKPDGNLSATGFVISQRALIEDMIEFAFTDAFEQFQTTLKSIEEMTGLTFRGLDGADPLEALHEAAGGEAPRIPLTSLRSVVTE